MVLREASPYILSPVTQEMTSAADAIIRTLLPSGGVSPSSSVGWTRLAYITDTFGPRFSGSQALEDALSWIRDTAINEDHLRVTEQHTFVPKWVRGEEWAYMLEPRKTKLHMVGLGMSPPTLPLGHNITAEVIVFSGYEDMIQNCSRAVGKIVLFNTIFTEYGITVQTRTNAGSWASEVCNLVVKY